MASTFTTLLRLNKPALGDAGWGTAVNGGFTDLADSAIAGTTTLSTDADVTLTTANGAADQSRQMILNCTGSRAAQRTITAPATSKVYVVINGTTGGFGVKIVGVGPTTGVVVPNGRMAVVAWNGSDFVTLGAVVDLTATGNVSFDGGTFVFNESGADKDARFEGDSDPNLLFLDASTDRVGIGTNAPATKLNVYGGASGTDTRTTIGNAASALQIGVDSSNNAVVAMTASNSLDLYTNNNLRVNIAANGDVTFRTTSSSITTHEFIKNEDGAEIRLYDAAGNIGALIDTAQTPSSFSRFLHATAVGDCHLGMGALCTGSVIFMRAGNVEAARIDPSGNVGIGTTTPASGASLDVNGSIRAKQGVPDAADSSTTGYAFGVDGDTGMFSPVVGGGAGNGVLAFYCNDTEYVQINSSGFKVSGGARTAPVAVAFSASSMTVNCALSNVFTTTFTANVTVAPTISNPNDGQTINWFITQDGTGGRTMTWPTSFKWPAGVVPTLSTGANARDLVVATYLSATGFWYASLLKGFA